MHFSYLCCLVRYFHSYSCIALRKLSASTARIYELTSIHNRRDSTRRCVRFGNVDCLMLWPGAAAVTVFCFVTRQPVLCVIIKHLICRCLSASVRRCRCARWPPATSSMDHQQRARCLQRGRTNDRTRRRSEMIVIVQFTRCALIDRCGHVLA